MRPPASPSCLLFASVPAQRSSSVAPSPLPQVVFAILHGNMMGEGDVMRELAFLGYR